MQKWLATWKMGQEERAEEARRKQLAAELLLRKRQMEIERTKRRKSKIDAPSGEKPEKIKRVKQRKIKKRSDDDQET